MDDHDIRTVRRIAHYTLGAGADPVRRAREARDEAVRRLGAACHRGEPCEQLRAEFERAREALMAAYRERDAKMRAGV